MGDLTGNILHDLAYATSLEEYDKFFKKNCPRKVVEYFNENWHVIKSEWVLGLTATCGSFLNFTNNRLESTKTSNKLSQFFGRICS